MASELEGLFNITTNIEDSVIDYAEKNDTRVASLENKISALVTTVDSLVETCKSLKMKTADVQQKNDKIKQQKEKIAALKEQNEEYRIITEQKVVEITLLNQRLQHKEEMHQCRLELFQKIQDVEAQLKANIQEKQELNSITAEELRVKLLDLEEAVSKKAAQSSFDKLAEKSAISHVSPPPEPLKPIIAETNKDDLENSVKKAPPKLKVSGKDDVRKNSATAAAADGLEIENSETKDQRKNNEASRPNSPASKKLIVNTNGVEKAIIVNSKKLQIKTDVLLLMDSNRKFIHPSQIFGVRRTTIIKTSTAAEILGIMSCIDASKVHHIIISTGTNDTDKNEVGDIVHDLFHAAEEIQLLYPDADVHLSELLPRKEFAQRETKQINDKLNHLRAAYIHLITHENINGTHMFDDKHVHKRHAQLIIDNINIGLEKVEDYYEYDYHDDDYYELSDNPEFVQHKSGAKKKSPSHSSKAASDRSQYHKNNHRNSRNGYGKDERNNSYNNKRPNRNIEIISDLMENLLFKMEKR